MILISYEFEGDFEKVMESWRYKDVYHRKCEETRELFVAGKEGGVREEVIRGQ